MPDTTATSALVEDYLRRLDAAAAQLSPDRRSELVDGIREHIEDARRAGESDEAGLRTVLDRLGEPLDIVAVAAEDDPGQGGVAGVGGPVVRPRRTSIALEIWAVALLTAGSLVLVLGWTVGVVLLWASRRWTLGEKLLGSLVVPLGPFGVLVLAPVLPGQTCQTTSTSTRAGRLVRSAESCSGYALPPWLGITLLMFSLVGPFVVGGLLLRRARARADAEDLAAGLDPRA